MTRGRRAAGETDVVFSDRSRPHVGDIVAFRSLTVPAPPATSAKSAVPTCYGP